MKVNQENKCKFCHKLFCCLQCRIRHEVNSHFRLLTDYICCDLCNGSSKLLMPKQETTKQFIEHIRNNHLPLECLKCAVVFDKNSDFNCVNPCVPLQNIKNLNTDLNMVVEEEKIKDKNKNVVKGSEPYAELPQKDSCKATHKMFDASIDENGSPPNVSNSDECTNKTASPLKKIVRQTSTPMTKMLSELKRYSYESMSASSIQVSSIENCSSETDISPELPVMNNVNSYKQPNRRMQVAVTPYRQIMSKSIQRAISNHKQSYGRYGDSAISTPPLDLRTSPVIRRTNCIEQNSNPTSMTVRRIQKIQISEEHELNDQNIRNSKQEALEKSSHSRSKSMNSFYETCRSFETTGTSSYHLNATPTSSGKGRRSASYADRQKMSNEEKEREREKQWGMTHNTSPISKNKPPKRLVSLIDPKNIIKENGCQVDESKNNASPKKPAKTNKGIWSFLSSVFRFTSGETTAENPSLDNDPTDNVFMKRCSSFTGILTKNLPIDPENALNPYKRRRTTLSEGKFSVDENNPIRRVQRIQGRPPIDRMRQS